MWAHHDIVLSRQEESWNRNRFHSALKIAFMIILLQVFVSIYLADYLLSVLLKRENTFHLISDNSLWVLLRIELITELHSFGARKTSKHTENEAVETIKVSVHEVHGFMRVKAWAKQDASRQWYFGAFFGNILEHVNDGGNLRFREPRRQEIHRNRRVDARSRLFLRYTRWLP